MLEELNATDNVSLNVKANMKASYGVIIQEGMSYVDKGPSYFEKLDQEGAKSVFARLTMNDYREMCAKTSIGDRLGTN